MIFSFDVLGDPVGQGSMRHIGGGRMIASNEKALKLWRESIGDAVQQERNRLQADVKFVGAVKVDVRFCVPRSQAAVDRKYPIVTAKGQYDIDKAVRAILDGIHINTDLIENDSQVCDLVASQRFADGCPFGAHVTISVI